MPSCTDEVVTLHLQMFCQAFLTVYKHFEDTCVDIVYLRCVLTPVCAISLQI